MFSNCLKSSGRTGVIASEEEDVPVAVEQSYSGNYIVVFDPLDGSSNIDAAVSTGSIFGIYAPNDECLADIEDNGTVRASRCLASSWLIPGVLRNECISNKLSKKKCISNPNRPCVCSLIPWSRGAS